MSFTRVASLDDLWLGEMAAYLVRGTKVVLVRTEEAVVAFEDRCAHLGVPLSQGSLDGNVLTCSAHLWQYDARTGRGINPRGACLKAFATKVDGDHVFVDVQTGRDE
jgi:toluene monooxygenase system ferredoxin subunit